MSERSAIEWTSATWNPTTGCDRVSPGCDRCYALSLAKRLKAAGNPRYQVDGDPRTSGPGFGLTLHWDKLEEPLRWRQPRRIFVNSMSDLFHKSVPNEFIRAVFDVMVRALQHEFQILTKRPGRMASIVRRLQPDPIPNVWLGTSVEDQRWADIRIPKLLETPSAVRFLSCEPLLGPIRLDRWLSSERRMHISGTSGEGAMQRGDGRIDWIIVGGESGPSARPMRPEWARSLRDQSVAAGVPFFFKQWGGRTPKAGGRQLDDRSWDQFPPSHRLQPALA